METKQGSIRKGAGGALTNCLDLQLLAARLLEARDSDKEHLLLLYPGAEAVTDVDTCLCSLLNLPLEIGRGLGIGAFVDGEVVAQTVGVTTVTDDDGNADERGAELAVTNSSGVSETGGPCAIEVEQRAFL